MRVSSSMAAQSSITWLSNGVSPSRRASSASAGGGSGDAGSSSCSGDAPPAGEGGGEAGRAACPVGEAITGSAGGSAGPLLTGGSGAADGVSSSASHEFQTRVSRERGRTGGATGVTAPPPE